MTDESLVVHQPAFTCYSIQHSRRLDQRLHMLRDEVRIMSRDKERGERVWRERVQRLQRQLKSKEEEMSRQSQYFENFKSQLQHKLSLCREREQSLQNRIYTLEKQLLDVTVSAATGISTITAVRITAGTVTHSGGQERLTFMRGEGEGEEEKKEDRKKLPLRPSVLSDREGGREGDEGKSEKETEAGRKDYTKLSSNESKLQGFILSLQEDLKVLLEREEDGMTERRTLTEQLQEAQEKYQELCCKTEEMKSEIEQLRLSECSLVGEVEELREENHRLQSIITEAANPTDSQTSSVQEPDCPDSGLTSPSGLPATFSGPINGIIIKELSSAQRSEVTEVQSTLNGRIDESYSSAFTHNLHQVSADSNQLKSEFGLNHDFNFQSLSLATETIDEIKGDSCHSGGLFTLEGHGSEETEALREAYRSLGFGEDLEALQEERDRLEEELQNAQEKLELVVEENAQLKLKLRNQAEDESPVTGSLGKQIDHLQTSLAKTDTNSTPPQDELLQALNQENRALANRIQQLLAHMELREEELKEHASGLEEHKHRLELENKEQGCLITELTRKTEDDLNTIMELQQRLDSGKEDKSEERVTKKDQEPNHISSEGAEDFSHNNKRNLPQDDPENLLLVNPLNVRIDHLNKTIQSLTTQQEEVAANIKCLREQQAEVTVSVQTKTEEKQQLTRTVWGLKEEKDSIYQSLSGLKQEKEQLSRTVCGLKDKKDQFILSMSALKEEKEQLTTTLSALKIEKEALTEHLLTVTQEGDQIKEHVQSLQTESHQLSQAVRSLKQERDELTVSLKCLQEQRDQKQSVHALKEERDKLIKSVSSLREEKEGVERSIVSMKEEEKKIMIKIQGLKEGRFSLQSALSTHADTQGGSSVQEQSDLLREVEALREQLHRSQVEVERREMETKKFQRDLSESEVRREEAERTAAEKGLRLIEVSGQMEESRMDSEHLSRQVKELQIKVTGLVKEKTEALSHKTQIEEQYNILTAQLRAKTVALEELNYEYIALKLGQGCKEDMGAALTSIRSRYNDIRAKYDALLKKSSQSDLDLTPLKAKLSCLVVKCQERNSVLAQMVKVMRRQGCADSTLTQHVEQLLSDAALQDYTAAFSPGTVTTTRTQTAEFTPRFISTFHDITAGPRSDHTCPAVLTPANVQQHNGLTVESGLKSREFLSERHVFISTSESLTNQRGCRSEVTATETETLKRKSISPVPPTPVQDRVSPGVKPVVPALKESSTTTAAQGAPSASGTVSSPRLDISGFPHSDARGRSPELSILGRSSLTLASTSPLSSTCVSPSRRLCSPEKIISLHEELQRTLKNSFQGPVSRGRRQESRNLLSVSSPADLDQLSHRVQPSSSFRRQSTPLPVSPAPNLEAHSPIETTKPAAATKSTTLFNAMASRSANVAFTPLKAEKDKCAPSAASTTNNKSFLSSGANKTTSPEIRKKVSANSDASDDTPHCPPTPPPLRTDAVDSNHLICCDTNSKATASDTTAPGKSTTPKFNRFNGAPSASDGLLLTASWPPSARLSPGRTNKSTSKSPAGLHQTKSLRSKPEAPAEVQSVEVINRVGQSSLMIGWERPPLDELGCSNGTFVYGYRVFIDGEFHKSVMSSACTKCIAENVDLSCPVDISLQTLGSNGLISRSVHTTYRSSTPTLTD